MAKIAVFRAKTAVFRSKTVVLGGKYNGILGNENGTERQTVRQTDKHFRSQLFLRSTTIYKIQRF